MASIVGIVYPDEATAEKAMDTVAGLQDAGFLKVHESLWVTKNEKGDVDVNDKPHPVLGKAAGGAVLGGLAGLLFLVPVAGLAIGAAAGGLIGRAGRTGAEDDIKAFTSVISDQMKPGSSAIIVFGDSTAPARVADEMAKWGGVVVSAELSDDIEAQFQAALDKG